MSKRKAEDVCSPARSKQSCFQAPKWVHDGQHRTLHMISSPVRMSTASYEGDINMDFQQQSSHRHRRNGSRHGQQDIDMDCSYAQTAWIEYLDATRTQELPDVSREQFNQVVAQNEALEATVDSLTQDLTRAKSRISELLEAQRLQQYVYQNCAIEVSHMPRPGFQQPLYFAPHQSVPAPRVS
ncbi:hypothetical protein CLAFUW4_08252 [Fulvia fulva]|uniref:Uncharacterized protein n=1 Tax=Passalora fulva TaxID=5499 RepID=A0A9Q8LDY3_PASFU|nr:uncharacterized protein CLAFUR5_08362 [Fulvia fulva]KAK4629304.1 hypothetical protein CLAFUR4_08257 [Fulvia fulva]KAK4630155.1 hypothetical protein CLAFUR0_08252 [Fulvia fulva]UJO15459.1 hypothetical protein CLAFUR5_08362 [Fulvia fulva]WPV12749.1 hypothetical protein CLAFUW4_08252 [Fulvia fulva]WPV27726.1 hypothetical protein CLAFUW7_08252 [Fulvia fulva]